MSERPLVSVIIPTYNRYAFLQEAVESVRSQTFSDFEIIIVDDCSEDGTEEAFSGCADIRYVRLEERGFPSGARNRGAEAAQGGYIAFLDSDDLWNREKLEKQMEFFREHPGIRICHTDEQWIRNGRKVNQRKKHEKCGGYIFSRCLERCIISPSAVCMEKRLFREYGGFDETIEVAEDYHLWLRVTAREKIGFIPEKLTVKRGGHEDQLSAKYGQIEIFRIQALEKVLEGSVLSSSQKEEAAAELAKKYRIYAQGCFKRGKEKEGREYEEKAGKLERGTGDRI